MASSLPFVVGELSRSIESLAPSQQFQVIVFRSPPASKGAGDAESAGYEMFTGAGGGLLSATRDMKDRVRAWLAPPAGAGQAGPGSPGRLA